MSNRTKILGALAIAATLTLAALPLLVHPAGPKASAPLPTMAGHALGALPPTAAPPAASRFKARHLVASANPAKVDLRDRDTPIENQGSLGSCTSFGWAGAVRFREHNAAKPAADLDFLARLLVFLTIKHRPTPPGPADVALSHLFIYWNERNLEGTVNRDSGAQVATGAKVVSTLGVPPESAWPYDVGSFRQQPPRSAYDAAKPHATPAPASIDNTDLDETRTALAHGHPVVFGFSVASSFENVGPSGVYRPAGRYVGGHCVCAVGYDDERKVLIVRNSWGTGWGEKGYFYMPYSTYTDARVTSDAWTIADDAAPPAPAPAETDHLPIILVGAVVVAAGAGFAVARIGAKKAA